MVPDVPQLAGKPASHQADQPEGKDDPPMARLRPLDCLSHELDDDRWRGRERAIHRFFTTPSEALHGSITEEVTSGPGMVNRVVVGTSGNSCLVLLEQQVASAHR